MRLDALMVACRQWVQGKLQPALAARVAEHREIFFRNSWVDYSTHRAGSFRLVPDAGQKSGWQADYDAMRGPMFYGETPPFAEILAAAQNFQDRFNATATG